MAQFRILTFGCKVNQCDSQIIRETLMSWGLSETAAGDATALDPKPERELSSETPDLVVINTCTVTGTADAKFRKSLRRTRREHPRALIAVTGCYASRCMRNGGECPDADVVFGQRDFIRLVRFLSDAGMVGAETQSNARAQSYFAEHTRAFLKIQDGCDCFCSYCVVPIVRPAFWSEEPDTVIAAVNNFVVNGYKEVVLSGIHLGFYGRGSDHGDLFHLLERLDKECRIDRIRLSSIEVNEVTDEIMNLISNSDRLCHHLHIPLQSGDDNILQAMGRRYSSSSYIKKVEQIQTIIPDIGLSTDIIVGFPGETEQQFERTLKIVDAIDFAKIHVFRFSSRPGTRAAPMDSHVPPKTKSLRATRLIRSSEIAAHRFRKRFIGSTVDILPDNITDDSEFCTGLTSNYIRVGVPVAPLDDINRILPVRIINVDENTGAVIGTVVT